MEFTVRLADVNIRVVSLYDEVHELYDRVIGLCETEIESHRNLVFFSFYQLCLPTAELSHMWLLHSRSRSRRKFVRSLLTS